MSSPKQGAYIIMMFWGIQKSILTLLLSIKTGSHVILEKNNNLSKGKSQGTCLLNQTWRKETDTWWKVLIWKFTGKIGREIILITLIFFSLICQSSLSSSNIGASLLWFVSVFLLSTPICWNFKISTTCLYPNTFSIQYMFEIQVSLVSVFFPRLFCRLLLNF